MCKTGNVKTHLPLFTTILCVVDFNLAGLEIGMPSIRNWTIRLSEHETTDWTLTMFVFDYFYKKSLPTPTSRVLGFS